MRRGGAWGSFGCGNGWLYSSCFLLNCSPRSACTQQRGHRRECFSSMCVLAGTWGGCRRGSSFRSSKSVAITDPKPLCENGNPPASPKDHGEWSAHQAVVGRPVPLGGAAACDSCVWLRPSGCLSRQTPFVPSYSQADTFDSGSVGKLGGPEGWPHVPGGAGRQCEWWAVFCAS